MNLANKIGGLVIGTGDMSELALGWATYKTAIICRCTGVNCSVRKMLVRIWCAIMQIPVARKSSDILLDVLDTPVSPSFCRRRRMERSHRKRRIWLVLMSCMISISTIY